MNKIFKFLIGILMAFTLLILIFTTANIGNRQQEVQSTLATAIEETVETMMQSNLYSINDQDEFVADFIESLSQHIESNAGIEVRVMAADEEKGLLSIKVIEHYKHLNGNDGQVSCDKTVIFNQTPEQEEPLHTVTFYLSGEVYKIYQITDGEPIILPNKKGITWKDDAGNTITQDYMVTQDVNIYG